MKDTCNHTATAARNSLRACHEVRLHETASPEAWRRLRASFVSLLLANRDLPDARAPATFSIPFSKLTSLRGFAGKTSFAAPDGPGTAPSRQSHAPWYRAGRKICERSDQNFARCSAIHHPLPRALLIWQKSRRQVELAWIEDVWCALHASSIEKMFSWTKTRIHVVRIHHDTQRDHCASCVQKPFTGSVTNSNLVVVVVVVVVSCFLFLVSCFLFLVSCFLFLVSCFLFLVSCFLFLVSCFLFLVSCFLFLVSCFLFLVSCSCCCFEDGIQMDVSVHTH